MTVSSDDVFIGEADHPRVITVSGRSSLALRSDKNASRSAAIGKTPDRARTKHAKASHGQGIA